MLRPERRDVDDRRDCEEVVPDDRVKEDLGPNVDEVVVEEDHKDDPYKVMLMTTAKTMKLAKKMSMSKVDARRCREEGMDLVVERCEEEVVQKMVMVMCRCGWGGESLLVCRGEPGVAIALLPC